MDEDRLLSRVTDAVQDVQTTFRDFYRDELEDISALDQKDLLDLAASLQNLHQVIQTFDRMDSESAQLELAHSTLAKSALVSSSDTQITGAESIISDMNKLKQQFLDMPRYHSLPSSHEPRHQFYPGHLRSMCYMVKGYLSMVKHIWDEGTMCDTALFSMTDILTHSRNTANLTLGYVRDTIKQINDSKEKDKYNLFKGVCNVIRLP
jgi:hypothetical protein